MPQIVRAAGMKDYLSNPNAATTFLAPNDEAVLAFLAATGRTLPQLLRERDLLFRLLQYTSMQRVLRTSYWPAGGNGEKTAKTLIPGLFLNLWSDNRGGRYARGLDNTAKLVWDKSNLVCGRSVVHVVRQVLRPFVV